MLPNDKPQYDRLIRPLRMMLGENLSPSELVLAVLKRWRDDACPLISLGRRVDRIKNDDNCFVENFALWLSGKSFSEGAFWISSAYADFIGEVSRKTQAMYFTPPDLAERMLDHAGKLLFSGRILDPACGGAAFLVPAVQRIAKKLSACGLDDEAVISHIEKNVFGRDTDKFLCFLSESLIRMALAKHVLGAKRLPRISIKNRDGLEGGAGYNNFDLVLCNPPYRKMTASECQVYELRYREVMVGQPNFYSLFIRASSHLLGAGGVAVYLTPMSFLSGRSFSGLRNGILRDGTLISLDFIGDKDGFFLGAQQDAVVMVWVKGKSDVKTKISSLDRTGIPTEIANLRIDRSIGPWPLPRSAEDAYLLPLFNANLPRLADYGYSTLNGAIVPHRNKRLTYKRMPKEEGIGCVVPLVWSANIGANRAFVLDNLEKQPQYIDVGSACSRVVIRGTVVAYQRVTSADQRRRLVCAAIPEQIMEKFGGVAGENHVGFLCGSSSSKIDAKLLADVLSTEIVDRLFRCVSGVTNVSAYEINIVPMPRISVLNETLAAGFDIEEAVRAAYGLDFGQLQC